MRNILSEDEEESMSATPLTNVLLTFPTLLQPAKDTGGDKPTSWIQLARTGSFVSSRYGKFSITKDDLSQMQANFENITPKSPTELPVDYDHLSMDPKKPGDGIAAGWMKKLELRENGEELWAEVEWTPDGADRVRNNEYRFVSPSFVKNHTHKDGKKIGTTLLAAAITNHPFLEGMNALTLYNFSAMGDLGLIETPAAIIERAVHLAEAGQVLRFADDPALTPELTAAERQMSVVVKSTIGDGDDQVVRVTTPDGDELGWFSIKQFVAADAPQKEENSPMPAKTTSETQLSATEELNALALSISKERNIPFKLAATIAASDRQDLVDGRAKEIRGTEEADETAAPVVHHLRQLPDESFVALVARVKHERNLDDKAALLLCSSAFPGLAETWENGTAL